MKIQLKDSIRDSTHTDAIVVTRCFECNRQYVLYIHTYIYNIHIHTYIHTYLCRRCKRELRVLSGVVWPWRPPLGTNEVCFICIGVVSVVM
jgi:hypothetical protein